MSNHFHRLVETPRRNLVDGTQWLLRVYTSRFNNHHKEFGRLFSGRYKTLLVDASGNGYLSIAEWVKPLLRTSFVNELCDKTFGRLAGWDPYRRQCRFDQR